MAGGLRLSTHPEVPAPLNRKERRRLAAQTRQPATACACCLPKVEPSLLDSVDVDGAEA